MKCQNCRLPIEQYGEHHRYCPNCGTRIVVPEVEWNVFSPRHGRYSTRYGGLLSFDRDAILEAEKNNRRYGEWNCWLGSYSQIESAGMGSYAARYKVLTWEKISYDAQGNIVLTPEETPAEGVEVTYLE